MRTGWIALAALSLGVAGCNDDKVVAVRDITPPAAPQGLYSVTGDHSVTLYWVPNTEPDLVVYKVFMSPCGSGSSCPYDYVMTTTTPSAVVTGLTNGTTRFFAVSAVDRAGNESRLSGDVPGQPPVNVFDTPRPAGGGLVVGEYSIEPAASAVDFSAYGTPGFLLAFDAPSADVYHGVAGGVHFMYAPFTDTDIQDAGYATSLDAVDFAPLEGWSADGVVELIKDHNYIVWTFDNHFAKFRVVSISDSPSRVTLSWAYQTAAGNQELAAQKPRRDGPRVRRGFGPAS